MPRKILTVDDSRTMRDTAFYTLKGAGFEVLESEDGPKALAAFATGTLAPPTECHGRLPSTPDLTEVTP